MGTWWPRRRSRLVWPTPSVTASTSSTPTPLLVPPTKPFVPIKRFTNLIACKPTILLLPVPPELLEPRLLALLPDLVPTLLSLLTKRPPPTMCLPPCKVVFLYVLISFFYKILF